MKLTHPLPLTIAGLVAIAIIVVIFISRGESEPLHPLLGPPPAAVVHAVRKELKDGRVENVDMRTREGQPAYEVSIEMPNGNDTELEINMHGELLAARTEMSATELPQAVRETAQGRVPSGGAIEEITRETAGGETTYRVEIEEPGQPDMELVLSEAGSVLTVGGDGR
jgi:uncharacterized membrane protein YkoI